MVDVRLFISIDRSDGGEMGSTGDHGTSCDMPTIVDCIQSKSYIMAECPELINLLQFRFASTYQPNGNGAPVTGTFSCHQTIRNCCYSKWSRSLHRKPCRWPSFNRYSAVTHFESRPRRHVTRGYARIMIHFPCTICVLSHELLFSLFPPRRKQLKRHSACHRYRDRYRQTKNTSNNADNHRQHCRKVCFCIFKYPQRAQVQLYAVLDGEWGERKVKNKCYVNTQHMRMPRNS